MSNTLTKLQPVLFSAAQEVSREPFGMVDAINAGFDDKGVAVGDKVKVPVAPTRAASDFTPSNTTSTGADATADDVEVTIDKSRKVAWHLTGEQIRSLDNGATSNEWIRQLMLQGMRTLRNEVEADVGTAVKVGSSRATGTAGTNPFSSDINAMVDLRKILQDNGSPMADLQLVMDTTSGANLRKLAIIAQADQAGTAEERRSGNFLRQYGFQLRESAGLTLHTAGGGTGYQANGALALDATTVAVDTGSGTVLAGDVVNFADSSDDFLYVVGSDLSSGSFTINRPGIRDAVADDEGVAIQGDYTPILGFERDAVVGIMRPPLIPQNPTIQQTSISDPDGMTFLLLDIAQYGQRTWELHLAWGFKVVQPEHVATLLS